VCITLCARVCVYESEKRGAEGERGGGNCPGQATFPGSSLQTSCLVQDLALNNVTSVRLPDVLLCQVHCLLLKFLAVLGADLVEHHGDCL
jgi:hypothetical protein